MGKVKPTKGEPRKSFSKTLMKMKFMNPEVETSESELMITKTDSKTKKKDITKSNCWELFYDVIPMARLSFNGINPDVEAMMKRLCVFQRDPNEHGKMDVDVTVEEMIARKKRRRNKKKINS